MRRKKNLNFFKKNNDLDLYFKTFFLNSFYNFYKFFFYKKKKKDFFLFSSNKKIIFYFFFNKISFSNISMFEKILKTLNINNFFILYLNKFYNCKMINFLKNGKNHLPLENNFELLNLLKNHYYFLCLFIL